MAVDLLPFASSGCILRSARPASALQFDYFRPKALSCLHEVSDVRHTHTKKTPKTNHASTGYMQGALCNKLLTVYATAKTGWEVNPPFLTLSLSVCLSLSVYLSVRLCLSLQYFSFCLHQCCLNVRRMASRAYMSVHLCALMVSSPSLTDSEQEITLGQASWNVRHVRDVNYN